MALVQPVCDTSPASVTDHELNLLVTIARSKRIRVDPDAVIAAVRAEVEQEAVVAASKVEALRIWIKRQTLRGRRHGL